LLRPLGLDDFRVQQDCTPARQASGVTAAAASETKRAAVNSGPVEEIASRRSRRRDQAIPPDNSRPGHKDRPYVK